MFQALLICNGQNPGAAFVRAQAKAADLVVAADGGANVAFACGVTPDVVIGDLDSVQPNVKRHFTQTAFIHVKRQDNTDFEKALDYLQAREVTDCIIVGATGKRLDFTIGNFLSVYPYLKHMRICFKSPKWQVYPLIKGGRFSAQKNARMSILPLSPLKGLSLKGLQYPLHQVNWRIGQTGLSNVVKNKNFEIQLEKGFLLLYLEHSQQARQLAPNVEQHLFKGKKKAFYSHRQKSNR